MSFSLREGRKDTFPPQDLVTFDINAEKKEEMTHDSVLVQWKRSVEHLKILKRTFDLRLKRISLDYRT